MSSREDVKKWMTFCNHMREVIIDEQKAVPDYQKLWKEAFTLPMNVNFSEALKEVIFDNIADEKKHKTNLLPLFNKICPRMAFHRKGIKGKLKLFGDEKESFNPSQYGAVITSEGIYTRRRKRRR